jgi:hypothetical protein
MADPVYYQWLLRIGPTSAEHVDASPASAPASHRLEAGDDWGGTG